jgi:hypothetical protein
MKLLYKKAPGGLLFLAAVMAALVFGPAGTIHYWRSISRRRSRSSSI